MHKKSFLWSCLPEPFKSTWWSFSWAILLSLSFKKSASWSMLVVRFCAPVGLRFSAPGSLLRTERVSYLLVPLAELRCVEIAKVIFPSGACFRDFLPLITDPLNSSHLCPVLSSPWTFLTFVSPSADLHQSVNYLVWHHFSLLFSLFVVPHNVWWSACCIFILRALFCC